MCWQHFRDDVITQGAASAEACRRTVGDCPRLVHSGNNEERSALPCRSVVGSTAPVGLEGAHQKGVAVAKEAVPYPFSQAAGDATLPKGCTGW